MTTIKQLVIYYFSGTGNAKRVTKWISEVAIECQIPVEVIDISKIDRKNIIKPPADALIGFCSPTHGFNFPPVMLHFIFRFPKSSNNKVFILNTRAGMKISKLFLPGLSGAAQFLSAIVLIIKSYRIVGMRSIDLPSNWISLHPKLQNKVIESIFERCKIVTIRFANKIFEGRKDYRALIDLPIDILIAPVSVAYYCIGRFFFAKSFYASAACDNCELCIKQCPVKAIGLVDNRPFWSYKCESCMHCISICPRRAIETAHGYIIGFLILLNTIMQSVVYIWFLNHSILWFSAETKYSFFLRLIFSTIVTFPALLISYRIVHYLRRIKFFDMLVTYTSLTKFRFWGRYKAPKENE
jgi:ferredoxin